MSEIKSALNDLNFFDVQFDMQFDRLPDYTANGIDAPEFLISTNPGEPLKPLGKVASEESCRVSCLASRQSWQKMTTLSRLFSMRLILESVDVQLRWSLRR